MTNYSLPRPIFNVRIYGILIDQERLLVSDEFHQGRNITKFPGGGLQFGEGTIDALKREFKEELDLEIDIIEHFYTVDFFQPSAFDATQQVISIYYLIKSADVESIKVADEKYVFTNTEDGAQSMRWVSLNLLQDTEFTFEIDQQVARLINEKFQGV